jgi:hypothetical protein
MAWRMGRSTRQIKEDPNLLKPSPTTRVGVHQPAVRFVWKAVTLATDQQLVYVIVQDQTRSDQRSIATVRYR